MPALALDPRRVPGPRSCRFLRSPPPCAPGLPPGSFVRGQFPASASRSCVRHCLGFISSFLLTLGWPLAAISSSRAAWHRDALGAPSCQLCGDAAPQTPPPGPGGCSPACPQLQRRQDASWFHIPRVRVHPHRGFLESCTWARPAKLRAALRTPAAPPARLGHLFQVTDG